MQALEQKHTPTMMLHISCSRGSVSNTLPLPPPFFSRVGSNGVLGGVIGGQLEVLLLHVRHGVTEGSDTPTVSGLAECGVAKMPFLVEAGDGHVWRRRGQGCHGWLVGGSCG